MGIFLGDFVALVVVISQTCPNQRNLRAAWHVYGLTKTDIQYVMLAFMWLIPEYFFENDLDHCESSYNTSVWLTIIHCMPIIE